MISSINSNNIYLILIFFIFFVLFPFNFEFVIFLKDSWSGGLIDITPEPSICDVSDNLLLATLLPTIVKS